MHKLQELIFSDSRYFVKANELKEVLERYLFKELGQGDVVEYKRQVLLRYKQTSKIFKCRVTELDAIQKKSNACARVLHVLKDVLLNSFCSDSGLKH